MKKIIILFSFIFSLHAAAGQWKPAGGHIMTQWGENLSPENVLPEYPRPQMERKSWMNLNGLMTYDRKVVKLDEQRVRKSNLALIHSLSEQEK